MELSYPTEQTPLLVSRLLATLKILGVRHNKNAIGTMEVCFNRRATDAEGKFLEEIVRRAVACMPKGH